MSNESDADLLARYVDEHSIEAFRMIVDRYSKMVYHICRQITRDSHEAEDASQTVFIALCKKAAAMKSAGQNPAPWLHRAAVLAAVQNKRTRDRTLKREMIAASAKKENHSPGGMDLDQPDIQVAINTLPKQSREVIVMRYFQGCSIQETAQLLGRSQKTIEARTTSGLKNLRDQLRHRKREVSAAFILGCLEGQRGAAEALAPETISHFIFTACQTALGVQVVGSATAMVNGPAADRAATLLKTLWWEGLFAKARIVAASVAALTIAAIGICELAPDFSPARAQEQPVQQQVEKTTTPKSGPIVSQVFRMMPVLSTPYPEVGETLTVKIEARDAPPFAAWSQCLKFDNESLALMEQKPGSFKSFVPDSRSAEEINATGELRTAGYDTADNQRGTGILGVFTFKVLRRGGSGVFLEHKSDRNPFGCMLLRADRSEIKPNIVLDVPLEL